MRRGRTERTLDELAAIRARPVTADDHKRLRAVLGQKNGLAVSRAAEIVAEHGLATIAGKPAAELLSDAFFRFTEDPLKRDPQCRAKLAIVAALYDLDCAAGDVFRRGITWVQLEPVWGGRVDTAAPLRAHCAIALASGHFADIWTPLAILLSDPEPGARIGAAQAIRCSGNRELGLPLLHLRLRTGETDSSVLTACLAVIVDLGGDREFDQVASLLPHGDPRIGDTAVVCEAACLALGESRREAAVEPLAGYAQECKRAEDRRVAYAAIAMLRCDPAWDRLIRWIREAPSWHAEDAITALAAYRHDAELARRVHDTCEARGDADLIALAAKQFD